MEDDKLTILKDGEEIECDILFTFDSPKTGKSYIGYTDNTIADNGRKNIYVSQYDPLLGFDTLEDITDKEELEMVHDFLIEVDTRI